MDGPLNGAENQDAVVRSAKGKGAAAKPRFGQQVRKCFFLPFFLATQPQNAALQNKSNMPVASAEPKKKLQKKESVPDVEHAHRSDIEWQPAPEFQGLEDVAAHFKSPVLPVLANPAPPKIELDAVLLPDLDLDVDTDGSSGQLFDISIEIEMMESASDEDDVL